MGRVERAEAALIGALVADAASLGLHWIYDVERIAEVAEAAGGGAFVPVDPAHYQGVPSYFAHGARPAGGLTQYGEVLQLALRVLAGRGDATGGFDPAAYQAAYLAHFGPGGGYAGYIDRPTRGTLANLAAGQTDPSGIEDDQLPALATVPAVTVAFADAAARAAAVRQAVCVTHTDAVALTEAQRLADLLGRVIGGEGLGSALAAVADAPLQAALAAGGSSVAYGGVTGRACHLPMAMPLAFHILANSAGYAEAVATNIRAGGDSAGRAILIGAVMGATHGIGGAQGIPLDWLLRLNQGRALWADCRAVARAGGA